LLVFCRFSQITYRSFVNKFPSAYVRLIWNEVLNCFPGIFYFFHLSPPPPRAPFPSRRYSRERGVGRKGTEVTGVAVVVVVEEPTAFMPLLEGLRMRT